MSTPNTSKVKWVLEKDLFASYAKVAEYQERDNIAAPVIPLADLTELVEGLRFIALTKDQDVVVIAQRLLTQLEAHRKEG